MIKKSSDQRVVRTSFIFLTSAVKVACGVTSLTQCFLARDFIRTLASLGIYYPKGGMVRKTLGIRKLPSEQGVRCRAVKSNKQHSM